MTVLTENAYKNHAGNGSNTIFDFNFLIESEDELTVLHTDSAGTQTTLVLNTDYTINEVGNANGSYITFPLAGSSYSVLAEGEAISNILDLEYIQESDFENSGNLNLAVLTGSLDYIVRLMQILKRQVDRAIKTPEGTTETFDELVASLGTSAASAAGSATAAAGSATAAAGSASDAAASVASINLPDNPADEDFMQYSESGEGYVSKTPEEVANIMQLYNQGGREYVQNFIANQDTDTEHDLKMYCSNTSQPAYIRMTDGAGNYKTVKYEGTGIIKGIDGEWIATKGAGYGGLVNGVSLASGLTLGYFLQCNDDAFTGAFDEDNFNAVYDSDLSGANILNDSDITTAGLTWYSVVPITQRILDASSNFINCIEAETAGGGIDCDYLVPIFDVNDNTSNTTAAITVALTVPPNSTAKIGALYKKANGFALVTSLAQTDSTPDVTLCDMSVASTETFGTCHKEVRTNASRQVRYRLSNAVNITDYFYLWTHGSIYTRRP